jgi:hypothetical protein
MTKTIRLNDLQLVMLSSAAARDNGSLIPFPQNCMQDRARIGKAVTALLRRALIEELPVTDRSLAWREEDQDPIGLFITEAGRAAIGSAPDAHASDDFPDAVCSEDDEGSVVHESDPEALAGTAYSAVAVTRPTASEQTAPSSLNPARTGSKIATVVAMLEREQGATLDEMVEATGWLPHTTRAVLTGLRKKGRAIAKTKRGDVTCYGIAGEAGQ